MMRNIQIRYENIKRLCKIQVLFFNNIRIPKSSSSMDLESIVDTCFSLEH